MHGTELDDLEKDSCGFKEIPLSWMGPFFSTLVRKSS